MKKKLDGMFFWSWTGLAVASVLSSMGLVGISNRTHHLALASRQTSLTQQNKNSSKLSPKPLAKQMPIIPQPKSEDLVIVHDAHWRWKVTGLTVKGKSKDKITLPDGINVISKQAFKNATFKSFAFEPKSQLKVIGDEAFINCSKLESIIIPDTVHHIGSSIFKNCSNLTSDTVINNSPVLFDWWVDHHKYLGVHENQTLSEMNSIDLKSYGNTRGDSFTIIGKNAFVYDSAKKKDDEAVKLFIPGNVTDIYDGAFGLNRSCKPLSIEFGKGDERLTFYGNGGSLVFSDSVSNIVLWRKDVDFKRGVAFLNSWRGNIEVATQEIVREVANNLRLDARQISLIGNTVGDFIFEDDAEKKLVALSKEGKTKDKLEIPADVTEIYSYAFWECSKDLRAIVFDGKDSITLDKSALKVESMVGVNYYIQTSELAEELKKEGVKENNIFVACGDFYTSGNKLGGLTTNGNSKTVLTVKDCTQIAAHAFDGAKAQKIIFLNHLEKVDPSAFPTGYRGMICVLEHNQVQLENVKIDPKQIYEARGDFYINANNALGGLTESGKTRTKLELNGNIQAIRSGAFDGCSPSLKEILIPGSSVSIDPGVFNPGTIKGIPKNIQFKVYNASVRDELVKNGVKSSNINVTLLGHLSPMVIGIIAGAVVLCFIILGLGIGLPMRKQHKINVLNSKITHRRIDKLSTANAMAFKKVIEVTGTMDKKINELSKGMKALNAANPSPIKPTTPIKKAPTPPSTPKTSPSTKTHSTAPKARNGAL